MDWKDKVVVITGASSGIGKALAIVLDNEKVQLVMIGRNLKNLKAAEKEIKSKKPLLIQANVSKLKDVKKAVLKVREKFKKIDVLINNAGVGYYGSLEEAGEKEIEEQVETNFYGVIWCAKEFVPLIKKGGHLMNISSIAGKIAFPNFSVYCATKFAVIGFSESLWIELKDKGINVNCFMPSTTNTNFFHNKSWKKYGYQNTADERKGDNPKDVAIEIKKAIEENRPLTAYPIRDNVLVKFKEYFPDLARNIQLERFKKQLNKFNNSE